MLADQRSESSSCGVDKEFEVSKSAMSREAMAMPEVPKGPATVAPRPQVQGKQTLKHADHMQITCRSHADHMQITCRSHSSLIHHTHIAHIAHATSKGNKFFTVQHVLSFQVRTHRPVGDAKDKKRNLKDSSDRSDSDLTMRYCSSH